MDNSFSPLLPYIQRVDKPTLWLADENALELLENISSFSSSNLYLLSNRYDIVKIAKAKNIQAGFNDFDISDLSSESPSELPFAPERILYRISKEKALVHYLLNQCSQHFPNSELILCGLKQEGIKTYASKFIQSSGAQGKLKKNGNSYSGCFSHFQQASKLDDSNYQALQTIKTNHPAAESFISKPGVFGWQKIDAGTELLMQSLEKILPACKRPLNNILDLGCGYGWIFISLPFYLSTFLSEKEIESIVISATDNNAAALQAAQENALNSPLNVDIIASDGGDTLTQKYDLILCNPPFHQGFSHNKQLTEKFLSTLNKSLSNKGIAVLVANEFISLPKELTQPFKKVDVITQESGFKVILLEAI